MSKIIGKKCKKNQYYNSTVKNCQPKVKSYDHQKRRVVNIDYCDVNSENQCKISSHKCIAMFKGSTTGYCIKENEKTFGMVCSNSKECHSKYDCIDGKCQCKGKKCTCGGKCKPDEYCDIYDDCKHNTESYAYTKKKYYQFLDENGWVSFKKLY